MKIKLKCPNCKREIITEHKNIFDEKSKNIFKLMNLTVPEENQLICKECKSKFKYKIKRKV